MKQLITLSLFLISHALFSQQWLQKGDFSGQDRSFATGFSNGSFGYVCMGEIGSTATLSDLWRYDPSNDTWALIDTFPGTPRSSLVSFTIDTISYIGLGFNRQQNASFTDLYSYNPATATWNSLSSYPGTFRRGTKAASLNGKAYLIGGTGTMGVAAVSNQIWEYNPDSDSWVQGPNGPFAARTGGVAFATDSLIYYGLGHNHSMTFNDLWAFNPQTNVWTQMNSFPGIDRHSSTVFMVNGKAVVGGGHRLGGTRMSDYYVYDPSNDSWSSLPSFANGKRSGSAAFSLNSKGYIVSGTDSLGVVISDVWEYQDTSISTGVYQVKFSSQELSLFPNPSNGLVKLNTGTLEGTVQIFNSSGQLILEKSIKANANEVTIDLRDQASGIYLYSFNYGSGRTSGEIIVKRD